MSKAFCKRLIISIIVILSVLFAASLLFFQWDIARVNAGEKPLFIIHTDSLNDGGTNFYYGLGYQIIKWNRFSNDGNTIFVGTECHYIFGMIDPFHDEPTVNLNEIRRK